MKFCTNCGQQVPDSSAFCTSCGTDLRAAAPVVPVAKPEPVVEAPTAPVYEAPVYEAPAAPVYEAPKMEEPVYAAPIPAYAQGYAHTSYAPPSYTPPAYNPYGVAAATAQRPAIQLPTGRGLLKMLFLSLITLGIYGMVIWSRITQELNIVASRYDGKRTMSYFGTMMLAPLTLMIYPIVWQHKMCNRIGAELTRRGINYKFGASTMWLWGCLGSLIIVGPFIYCHKHMKAMNLLNADFNEKG